MPAKHAPIPLHRYEAIHETAMRTFDGFVEEDGLVFEPLEGTGTIRLGGEIRCVGGITISVQKLLEVVEGSDRHALVETVAYSYNVRLQGVGNVVRYDSPHPGHNADHHVHRYDVFGGSRQATTSMHGEKGWPTLSEVIVEAREWYWENHERVAALGRDRDGEPPSDDE